STSTSGLDAARSNTWRSEEGSTAGVIAPCSCFTIAISISPRVNRDLVSFVNQPRLVRRVCFVFGLFGVHFTRHPVSSRRNRRLDEALDPLTKFQRVALHRRIAARQESGEVVIVECLCHELGVVPDAGLAFFGGDSHLGGSGSGIQWVGMQ